MDRASRSPVAAGPCRGAPAPPERGGRRPTESGRGAHPVFGHLFETHQERLSMKAKKHAFVPSALGRLEDRVVLSGARFAASGAAILTTRAYNNAAGGIQRAFSQFATHGMNYNRLAGDLT